MRSAHHPGSAFDFSSQCKKLWPVLLGALLINSVLSTVLIDAAGAEIDSDKQTYWGTQTFGASETVAGWDALTWAIEQVDNTMYVGGNFLEVTNGSQVESQPYLAAFDADTGAWQSWFRPDVGNAVLALAASPDGGLFVGGEIDTWNGSTIGALQKIDPATGDPWPGWTVRAYGGTSVVRDIKLEADGWLYVVGGFTSVSQSGNPQPANGAFRVDPVSGAIDSNWKPDLQGGSAWGVARSETANITYIAGRFTSVNGDVDNRGFVGVDDSGLAVVDRAVVPYNGCTVSNYCSRMYDVEATSDGTVWVGGVEHTLYVLDEANNYDMVMQHYTGCDPSINAVCLPANWYGGEFQEIEEVGDRVYATCHCWYDHFSDTTLISHTQPHGNHTTVDSVAAYDPATGERIESFRPYLTGDAGGFAIHGNPSDGCLWLGGGFNSYGAPGGSQPAARDLVRICDEAGPGPTAQPDPPPPALAECTNTLAGPDVTVAWTTGVPGLDSVVIERQINGGNWYWRTRVDAPVDSWTEPAPANSLTAYRVKARYAVGQQSAPIDCSPPVDLTPNLTAPTVCSTSTDGSNALITWDEGTDVTSYVVYRSVNAGNNYWRGKVDVAAGDGPDFTFTDPIFVGATFSYQVVAKGANGTSTTPVVCSPSVEIQPPTLVGPTTCTASVDGTDGVVAWDEGENVVAYVVYRSVNAGNSYWRGKVDVAAGDGPDFTFTDGLFANATFTYSVVAKGAGGTSAEPVMCSPNLELEPLVVTPPAICTVSVNGTQATLTFDPSVDTGTTIVFRTIVGGNRYWRGRVDNGVSTFADTTGNASYVWDVVAQMPDGTRSEPTVCSEV